MRRYRVSALLSLMMFAIAASGASAQSAVDILKKSYAAESKASFKGRLTTTIYSGSSSASAAVSITRSGRKSRMDYTSGPSAGCTIVDNGSSMIRLDKSAKTAYVSDTPEPPDNLSLLLANYQPKIVGSEKVAGRDCYIVKLDPRYNGNPSKSLWIDKSSMVALKTKRFSSEGKLAMSTVYTNADFSARPSSSLFGVPRGWKSVRLSSQTPQSSPDAVRRQVGFTPVKPGYVPRGYSFDGYFVCDMCRGNCSAGLRYTNGMNTLSVFERKGLGRGMGRGAGRGRGPGPCVDTGSNSHMATATTRDLTVVVVGDLVESELVKMANSVK